MLIYSEIPGACDALGLTRGPGYAFRATGLLDGAHVAAQELTRRGGENDLALFAWLPRPTDLGWQVVQGGIFTLAGDAVRIGDAAFDGVIDVFAGDPEAARALLGDEVRAALLRMVRVGSPTLTDDVVGFYTTSFALGAAEFTARLRWCVEAAHALDRRAAALPTPAALDVDGVAARFVEDARARGMSLRGNALCAEGALPTLALQARLRSVAAVDVPALQGILAAATAGYRVRARFHEPLGVGLTLRPAGVMDRVKELVGRGDLRLDDAGFDRAWTVAASDPDGARAMLHEGARAHLTRLTDAGLRFTLDDQGIEGYGALPRSPEVLPQVLWLLDALRDALRPRARGGAYR